MWLLVTCPDLITDTDIGQLEMDTLKASEVLKKKKNYLIKNYIIVYI